MTRDGERTRVLVVDDDPGIRDVVRAYALREGFEVLEAADGLEADRRVAEDRPDLVVLDLMIPEIDGWELCRRWRSGGGPPVIMLTARGAESERILGLGVGADDYLVKPFSPLELMARIRAVLRRSSQRNGEPAAPRAPAAVAPDATLRFGDLEIDMRRRSATRAGQPLHLSRRELDLLASLAGAGDRVSSRLELLRVLGEGEIAATERAVDQHMVALRRELARVGSRCRLESVRGIGYRLAQAETGHE